MELFKNTNYDFLGKKWLFIILSAILTLAGLISLVVKGGPRYGIDFTGGALVYVKFADRPPVDKIRAALAPKLPGGVPDVQEVTGANEVIIGTEIRDEASLQQARQTILETLAGTFGETAGQKLDINNASRAAIADRIREPLQGVGLAGEQVNELAGRITEYRDQTRSGIVGNLDQLTGVQGLTPQVLDVLKGQFYTAPYNVRSAEIVGPKIGAELRKQAIYVVLAALGGMLVYIAFRFEWIYGVAAVLAVFHDVVITVGLFSLTDKEITLTVIAALLTLVGFSMNDTIVIFDRIRENLKIYRRESLDSIINKSVNQTLSRTIMTSGLTFLTALALYLFGGPVLNGFAFALVIGIVAGTYSSIFIAAPVLVYWHDFAEKRKRAAAPAAVSGAVRRK